MESGRGVRLEICICDWSACRWHLNLNNEILRLRHLYLSRKRPWVWSEVGREPRKIEHSIISAGNFLYLFERESILFWGVGGNVYFLCENFYKLTLRIGKM